MFKNSVFEDENRHVTAISEPQVRIGVDIDFLELHAERAQLGRHLLAEMAARAAVEPGRAFNPCQ